MKKLLYLAIGVVIGASIGFGPNAYAAVKQFVLTEFNRPVVVDGVVYKDPSNPILNYNGKTYIPLAKIGQLTGVDYKWNAEKRQVEINSKSSQSLTYTIDDGKLTTVEGTLAEEEAIKDFTDNITTVIVGQSGLVEEDGQTVLYIVDKYGTKKRLTNEDDTAYIMAKIRKNELPPSISEGWISGDLLKFNIQGYTYITDVPNDQLSKVKTKDFGGTTYYNINDLINVGLLKID